MRSFAAFGFLLLLAITVIVTTCVTNVDATTKHGCAPLTPPSVSGTLIQPPAQHGLLFINEVLLMPHSTWNCSELNIYTPTMDTWVEIYNGQNQPFDLYAVHASLDSGNNTNPFYFPFGSAIAPHGYLVVFPRTSATFLASESATLRLLIAGVAVDTVTLPALAEDQSYARIPDGTTIWQITSSPTIDASNILPLPTPSPTSSASHSSKGNGSGSSGGNSGSNGYGSGNTNPGGTGSPIVNGTQPAWSTLHLPTTDNTTNTTYATTPSQTTALLQPTQAANDAMDTPRKLALTVLLVLLAAALFWCWRLFRKP